MSLKKKNALINIQHNGLRSYCVQDKEPPFAVLHNQDYIKKVNYRLQKSYLLITKKLF